MTAGHAATGATHATDPPRRVRTAAELDATAHTGTRVPGA